MSADESTSNPCPDVPDPTTSGSVSPQLDEGLAGISIEGGGEGVIYVWKLDSESYVELVRLDKGVSPDQFESNKVVVLQTNQSWSPALGLQMINQIVGGDESVWWCLTRSMEASIPVEPNREGSLHELFRNGGEPQGVLFREKDGPHMRTDTYLLVDGYTALKENESLTLDKPSNGNWNDAIQMSPTTAKMYRLTYTWFRVQP